MQPVSQVYCNNVSSAARVSCGGVGYSGYDTEVNSQRCPWQHQCHAWNVLGMQILQTIQE